MTRPQDRLRFKHKQLIEQQELSQAIDVFRCSAGKHFVLKIPFDACLVAEGRKLSTRDI